MEEKSGVLTETMYLRSRVGSADGQQAAWRKTLEVFDESTERFRSLGLLPEDRPMPVEAVDTVHCRLSEIELRDARSFGDCWLG